MLNRGSENLENKIYYVLLRKGKRYWGKEENPDKVNTADKL